MTLPGLRWRILAQDDESPWELSGDGRRTLDEVVIDDWFHLEQMSKRRWWMRVGDVQLRIHIPKTGKPVVSVERDE